MEACEFVRSSLVDAGAGPDASAADAVLLEAVSATSDDDVQSISALSATYTITVEAVLAHIDLDATGDELDAVVRALCGYVMITATGGPGEDDMREGEEGELDDDNEAGRTPPPPPPTDQCTPMTIPQLKIEMRSRNMGRPKRDKKNKPPRLVLGGG